MKGLEDLEVKTCPVGHHQPEKGPTVNIIAIDPGPVQSAVVEWDGARIISAEIIPNEEAAKLLEATDRSAYLVCEWIESYGMAVGKEVFLTCRWCGRFEQAYGSCHYVTRKQVKSHLCHTTRANDSNVRTALIDRFGAPGTKKEPGITYGLKKDLWAAFAVAVTYFDREIMREVG